MWEARYFGPSPQRARRVVKLHDVAPFYKRFKKAEEPRSPKHAPGDTDLPTDSLLQLLSSSLASSLIRLPSPLPDSLGMTSFMTLPRSSTPLAPTSAMLPRINSFISFSERGWGRKRCSPASSASSLVESHSRPR